MRFMTRLLATLTVLAFASHAFGQGLTGSAHDLTAAPVSATEICLPCHTPHSGVEAAGGLLWNHDATTGTGYQFYTTLSGQTGDITGQIKLCLICHDGLVSLDNYGGASGGSNFIAAGAQVGPDLRTEHPIGVDYPDSASGYYTVAAVEATLPLYDAGERVECGSCHDPHDTTNSPFLRVSNANSDLCLTCHDK